MPPWTPDLEPLQKWSAHHTQNDLDPLIQCQSQDWPRQRRCKGAGPRSNTGRSSFHLHSQQQSIVGESITYCYGAPDAGLGWLALSDAKGCFLCRALL